MDRPAGWAAAVKMHAAGSALCAVVVVALGAYFIRFAMEGKRASDGSAGTAGSVVTTSCSGGRVVECVGTFTPDDPSAGPARPATIPGWYPPGSLVHVRLLDGEAWPTDESSSPPWLGDLLMGIGLVVATVVVLFAAVVWRTGPEPPVAVARHRKRRHHRSR